MFHIRDLLQLPSSPAALWRSILSRCMNMWNYLQRLLHKQQAESLEAPQETPRPEYPKKLIYLPIPGSWKRKEHPEWPEEMFQIPCDLPYGTICYKTKGRQIAQGTGHTAWVELLASGDVIKYPKPNPYYPKEEEGNRKDMTTEAEVYRRLGSCPYVPKLINWHPESCSLTLEYLENGNLWFYIQGMPWKSEPKRDIPKALRQRWALQAASAIQSLHEAEVIHCDVTPRNFLLDADLNLRIADFAGSSISGSPSTVAPGSRFQPPDWTWQRPPKVADDIFAIGSVIYFIMVGEEPFAERSEDEVEELFQASIFPDVSEVPCGPVILGCWNGTLDTAERVVRELTRVYGPLEANTKLV